MYIFSVIQLRSPPNIPREYKYCQKYKSEMYTVLEHFVFKIFGYIGFWQ